MHWLRERIWKGDILIADLEELETQNFFPRRVNAKEVLISQKGEEFIFTFADGSAKLSGRDYEFREPTLRRERNWKKWKSQRREIEGETEVREPPEMREDAEARVDFLSIQGDFTCRHHNETRVQLFAKTRNIPNSTQISWCNQNYTHWFLEVKQEKRIDDYWNVDLNRHLSDSWTRFTRFILLEEKVLKEHMWSGGDRRKCTRLPDTIMCGLKYGRKPPRIEKNQNGQWQSLN